MSADIISAQPSNTAVDTRKKKILDETLKMAHEADLKEWEVLFLRIGTVWNMKHHRLESIADFTFDEFLAARNLSDRSGRVYSQIADVLKLMVIENVKSKGEETELEFSFSKKNIKDAFEPLFANGRKVTLDGLTKNARDLQQMKAYLNGDAQLPMKDVKKLLSENNTPSEKYLEKKQRLEHESKQTIDFMNRNKAKFAEEHGIVWDDQERCWRNKDGSGLSEAQTVAMTEYEDGIYIWDKLSAITAKYEKEIADTIHKYSGSYLRFSSKGNKKFSANVNDRFRESNAMTVAVNKMIKALHARDVADAESIHAMKEKELLEDID